jgi:hypothetical protein
MRFKDHVARAYTRTWEREEIYAKLHLESHKEREYLTDILLEYRIILKLILK